MFFNRKRLLQRSECRLFHLFFSLNIILFNMGCDGKSRDPSYYSDKVCACAEKSRNNKTRLVNCYQRGQQIKLQRLAAVEEQQQFDKAIRMCFGAAILDEITDFLKNSKK